MAFYVFYMWGLAIFTFRTRVKAVRSGEVKEEYFKSYTDTPPSERTIIVARHYDHQFQVPMLFFITCLVCLNLDFVNTLNVTLAWAFVVTRLAHSWVHLGSNYLPARVMTFAFGWFVIMAMWVQLLNLILQ